MKTYKSNCRQSSFALTRYIIIFDCAHKIEKNKAKKERKFFLKQINYKILQKSRSSHSSFPLFFTLVPSSFHPANK